MHRKRVTSELHDSYFRLMTIKHAIPKIEWATELLYNSVGTGSQRVGDQTSWRQGVVKKATTQLRSWRQDVVEKATIQQRAGPLGLRLSSPGERERHNADGHKSGGQYIAVLFGLQLPLTRKPYNKVRGIFFFKEVFARRYNCVKMYSACICIYKHIHYVVYTT